MMSFIQRFQNKFLVALANNRSTYRESQSKIYDRTLKGKKSVVFFLELFWFMSWLSIIFQGILIVIWKILSNQITGIFIAINVLDTITNFGQVCILVCMITTAIMRPCIKSTLYTRIEAWY